MPSGLVNAHSIRLWAVIAIPNATVGFAWIINDLQDLHKWLMSLVFELWNLKLHIFFGTFTSAADDITILVSFKAPAWVGFAAVYQFFST